ncbi:MAG: hydantoinase B/oxoprolinase family protein, partial [Emcibacter sp.]|nr:hydantoinase B/oxoprolinase family protein [Emcibacter sp.]
GSLIANTPHVPVHLGSMDSTIKVLIQSGQDINPGDVFVHNNPYNGGSHLPDITIISPIFDEMKDNILFFVASRAHHEDVGGIAPGSMSPRGKSFDEEGIVLDCVKLIDRGVFLTEMIEQRLGAAPYPARNIDQNIADLLAQVAANKTGANELQKLVSNYGFDRVNAYMGYIQDNAEETVRKAIAKMSDTEFKYNLDGGTHVDLKISIDKEKREATIDFTGTSAQLPNNFNAPVTVTHAAVLYVFRCLVDDDIPLNAGCLKPLTIKVAEGSMLNPMPPAAVVAGNVETSQAVTNALFGALGVLAASQGTMNNLTFGNDKYQYYETICSGSPAGRGFNGVAAVHTHMTNTRLTDPEIMENRYPVMLQNFTIERASGGKGKWNAGDGIIRSIRFLDDMECSILSGHRLTPPFGLEGGQSGRMGKNWITRQDGQVEDLGGCAQTDVHPGDIINIRTPTGGGFGDIKCG